MICAKRTFFISVLFVFTSFLFCSCNLEAVINSLSKTGGNIFVGSKVSDSNVDKAVETIDNSFGGFEEKINVAVGEIANTVEEFINNNNGQIAKNFLGCLEDILEDFKIPNEDYENFMHDFSKATSTPEGVKKIAKELTSPEKKVSIVTEEIKGLLTEAVDGIERLVGAVVEELGASEGIMIEAQNILVQLKEELNKTSYEMDYADMIVITCITTAVYDSVKTINGATTENSNLISAFLSNDIVVSEAASVFQVVSVISDGCKMNNEEPPIVVSVMSQFTNLIADIVNAGANPGSASEGQ